jgi:hypothetical protein
MKEDVLIGCNLSTTDWPFDGKLHERTCRAVEGTPCCNPRGDHDYVRANHSLVPKGGLIFDRSATLNEASKAGPS